MRRDATIIRCCWWGLTRLHLLIWPLILGVSTRTVSALPSQSRRRTTVTTTTPTFDFRKARNKNLFHKISGTTDWRRCSEHLQEYCEEARKADHNSPSIFSSSCFGGRHQPQQKKILLQQPLFIPFRFTAVQSIITKMGAALSTLSVPEMLVLGIFIPSALNKMLAPSIMRKLWPTLPKRIWFPTGVYEITGAFLTILTPEPYSVLGFAMLYSFMGGVLSSIVYIPNNEGHTHISGKGKLGWAGLGPLLPTTGSTALLYTLDKSSTTPIMPCLYFTLGFGIGTWIYHSNKKAKMAKRA